MFVVSSNKRGHGQRTVGMGQRGDEVLNEKNIN